MREVGKRPNVTPNARSFAVDAAWEIRLNDLVRRLAAADQHRCRCSVRPSENDVLLPSPRINLRQSHSSDSHQIWWRRTGWPLSLIHI